MKISLNLMKWYSGEEQWKLPAKDLVAKIGTQLGAVEEVVDLSPKYKGVIVARVVGCVAHPDSDHMSICKLDDGGIAKDVERDENGYVQVVCGAPNVRQGLMVAWLPPGSVVPQTYNKEPFVLGAKQLRGVLSSGMIASGKELDINDDHAGIVELDNQLEPGSSFAELYSLNDTVIDIENKMFTHRPDCFGNLGVAREIAGIQQLSFDSPDWYISDVRLPKPNGEHVKLEVVNEIPKLVPRYMAVALDNIKIAPSPLWLQTYLQRLGIRPISNVVDVTNYLMVLTGQPLHAFDYDKVSGQTIVVRKPKQGEQLPLLDGRTIQPYSDAMLICDTEKPIGLGGMMGGGNSEITDGTTRIVLECATFDMYTIRRTSMHHGIFTDAVTRFSKGQSPLQCSAVLAKAIAELEHLCGARIASPVVDSFADTHQQRPIKVDSDFINLRLGTHLQADQIATILRNVEFKVDVQAEKLVVTPPFWRTDIEIPEDLVEEVGRLLGYDKVPHQLPSRSTSAVNVDPMGYLKSTIRNTLSAAGANELQTYSFVPARLMQAVGQEKSHAFAIRNALSPELQHYRLSLTPNLLEKVHPNIKAGYSQFALFEMNKIHIKGDQDHEGLPREYQTLALTYASKNDLAGAPYYTAKRYLEYLLQTLGVPHQIVPAEHAPQWEVGRQVFAPFEPQRSAYLIVGNEDGEFGGFVGEYNMRTRKNLKLPSYSAGFEVDLDRLLKFSGSAKYQPLLKFPAVDQDVCLKVGMDSQYSEIEQQLRITLSNSDNLRIKIAPVSIYQRPGDEQYKQITYRVTLQNSTRTLTNDEVNEMLDEAVARLANKLGAERI